MTNLKYSLFVLRAQKHKIETELHEGLKDGSMDKANEEMLSNQIESLGQGVEILEKNLQQEHESTNQALPGEGERTNFKKDLPWAALYAGSVALTLTFIYFWVN